MMSEVLDIVPTTVINYGGRTLFTSLSHSTSG